MQVTAVLRCATMGSQGGSVTRLVGRVLIALVLATGAIAAAVWSVSAGADSLALLRFEQEDPASLATAHGLVERRVGFGPLERDVASLSYVDGQELAYVHETVHVVRVGEPRAQWPRPEFLVGEHGARYADEPAHEGAWIPFAVAAGGGLLFAVVAGWFAVRMLLHVVRTGGFVIFGQRDPQGSPVTMVPGGGTHGGMGGQVPPYVPYNPDWTPKNRIR